MTEFEARVVIAAARPGSAEELVRRVFRAGPDEVVFERDGSRRVSSRLAGMVAAGLLVSSPRVFEAAPAALAAARAWTPPVGDFVEAVRAAGYTAGWVARRCGVSVTTARRWMAGEVAEVAYGRLRDGWPDVVVLPRLILLGRGRKE